MRLYTYDPPPDPERCPACLRHLRHGDRVILVAREPAGDTPRTVEATPVHALCALERYELPLPA